ncbi:MAG: MlaD family protein, partial [Ignavibacteria bacterium]|nr:MlaD family protein [Ignavibacteria bacterium]
MLDTIKGARLGVFIFLGSILLVIGIFLIGNKDLIFKSTFEIKTYFKSVEGLREGSPVRLTGIDVGSVKSIKFSADTAGKILVVMRINSDAKEYIRKDSKASIETEGLVGNKVLLISGGTINYPAVEEGDVIESKDPIGFAEIIAETQGMLSYVKDITK